MTHAEITKTIAFTSPNANNNKFEWTLDNIIYIYIYIYIYSEVSALLDVRHCPKLQSFAISEKTRTTNEVTFRR